MKKELAHFTIGDSYGGNQDWFREPMMKLGGCGAETACDSSLYFTLHRGLDLYPFDVRDLSRRDYRRFGSRMRPYLSPRMRGIDRLDIYIDGYTSYLDDAGERRIKMAEFQGSRPYVEARQAVRSQIDDGYPVPTLVLQHRDPRFKEYVWHWFLLNGYDEREDGFFVKAVTYSNFEWLNLAALWDTGFEEKGGLVLYRLEDAPQP